MRCRTRSVAVLAALVLLTSAATAYAESAWMLWQESTTGWYLREAASTHAECIRLIDRDQKYLGNCCSSRRESPGKLTYRAATGDMVSQHCLPDTVDPRGPKGK